MFFLIFIATFIGLCNQDHYICRDIKC